MMRSLRGRLFAGLTAIILLTGAVGGTWPIAGPTAKPSDAGLGPDPDRELRAERLDQESGRSPASMPDPRSRSSSSAARRVGLPKTAGCGD